MATKERPGAVCLKCERPKPFTLATAQCADRRGDGQRCGGLISAAIAPGDWAECPTCSATRTVNEVPCAGCREEGWIYVRDKQWLKDQLQRERESRGAK
jgi:hypothetical protein